jgi:hypothetical protein
MLSLLCSDIFAFLFWKYLNNREIYYNTSFSNLKLGDLKCANLSRPIIVPKQPCFNTNWNSPAKPQTEAAVL